jgi:hypothetical protein
MIHFQGAPGPTLLGARTATRVGLVAIALSALGACADMTARPPGPTQAASSSETIAWSVGPCFGFCPVYTVTVSPSGTVTFDGERHTAMLGKHSREGGAQAYAATAAALATYRPASGTTAQTTCEQRMSDQSTMRITWTAPGGAVTTLEHDRGCRSPRNDGLNAALQALPAQLKIDAWAKQTTRPGVSRG